MSIISDFKSLFLDQNGSDFVVYESGLLGKASTRAFKIYGFLEFGMNKINNIPIKPLELGQFTYDTQNINPIDITLTGILYTSRTEGYIISEDLENIHQYQDSIKLLSIYDDLLYKNYTYYKLYDVNQKISVQQSIPLITLKLRQIQVTGASVFSNKFDPIDSKNQTKIYY